MKSIFSFFIRGFLSLFAAIITWPIAFWGFNTSFLLSSFLTIASGGIVYFLLKYREQQKLLKKNQLTRKEFHYISKNLKEAHGKIKRLNRTMWKIRSLKTAKRLWNLQQIVKQIYQIVTNEPKRFYQAERFFYYHLDSVVELCEHYVFLSHQNIHHFNVQKSLAEAEQALKDLKQSLDDDLLFLLSDDIETLNVELDFAKKGKHRDYFFLPKETLTPKKSFESTQQHFFKNHSHHNNIHHVDMYEGQHNGVTERRDNDD